MDIGRCNDFIFLNSLGFGFDGLTNYYAHQISWLPVTLRYAVAALRSNIHTHSFNVKIKNINGSVTSCDLMMVTLANGRVEGGLFWIAPEASVTDGIFNFVTVSPLSKWLIPLLLPLFLFKKGYWIPQVATQKVSEVTLIFEGEIPVHADGEIINSALNEFHISMLSSKLEVICGL